MGSQRARHSWATNSFIFWYTYSFILIKKTAVCKNIFNYLKYNHVGLLICDVSVSIELFDLLVSNNNNNHKRYKNIVLEFPDDTLVRTPHSRCQGPGLDSWPETMWPTSFIVWPHTKTKNEEEYYAHVWKYICSRIKLACLNFIKTNWSLLKASATVVRLKYFTI